MLCLYINLLVFENYFSSVNSVFVVFDPATLPTICVTDPNYLWVGTITYTALGYLHLRLFERIDHQSRMILHLLTASQAPGRVNVSPVGLRHD